MRQLLSNCNREIIAFIRSPKNRLVTIIIILILISLYTQAIIRACFYETLMSDFNMFLDPAVDARFFDKNPFEAWPGNSYNAFFYVIMSLFSPFARWFAVLLWSILNTYFFIVCIYIIHQLLPKPYQSRMKYPYLIAPALMLFLFIDNIQLGQSNITMMLAILISIFYLIKKKHLKSGLAMGFAIAYKTTPLIFLCYFLLRGKFKAAFFSLGFALIFMFIAPMLFYSPIQSITYMKDWANMVLIPFAKGEKVKTKNINFYHTNQSLEAFIQRHFTTYGREKYGSIHHWVDPAFLSQQQAHKVATSLKLIFLLILSIFIWYKRKDSSNRQLLTEMSFFLIGMLLLSPSSWINHYIILLPAYILFIEEILMLPKREPIRKVLITTLIISTIFMFLGVDVFMQSLSVYFIGTCIFLLTFSYLQYRQRPVIT